MKEFRWEAVARVTVAGPDGVRKRHRAFPGTVRLQDGTLLVIYREGSDHWRTPDGILKLTRSTDGGKTWSAPETVALDPERMFSSQLGIRQLNDGRIIFPVMEVFPTRGQAPYFKYYHRMLKTNCISFSNDGGQTWTEPYQIDFGPNVIWTTGYGDIVELPSGDLVMSTAWQEEGDTVYRTGVLSSGDGGQTWDPKPYQIAMGFDDEKSICRLPSGRIVAVLRNHLDPSHLSYSDDDGKTWARPQALPFVGQCPSLLYTRSGVLLCAFRQQTPGKPRGVGLAYSFDGGTTWAEADPLYVAPQNYWDCAYPNLLEAAPGEYLVFYYSAAIGTQILTQNAVPDYPRYTDADNAIEMLRFRQRSYPFDPGPAGARAAC